MVWRAAVSRATPHPASWMNRCSPNHEWVDEDAVIGWSRTTKPRDCPMPHYAAASGRSSSSRGAPLKNPSTLVVSRTHEGGWGGAGSTRPTAERRGRRGRLGDGSAMLGLGARRRQCRGRGSIGGPGRGQASDLRRGLPEAGPVGWRVVEPRRDPRTNAILDSCLSLRWLTVASTPGGTSHA